MPYPGILMKLPILPACLLLASGCGGEATSVSNHPDSGPDSGSDSPVDSGSPDVSLKRTFGSVFAETTSEETVDVGHGPQPAYILGAELFPLAAPEDACQGSTDQAGACCFIPPPPPPPGDAGGYAGCPGPDGGDFGTDCSKAAYVMANAGTLTFQDSTDHSTLGSLVYGDEPHGFGFAVGYPQRLLNPVMWKVGDVLSVSGSGAQIGAFTVSAPALSIPAAKVPSTIASDADWTLTWSADPNATILTLSLSAWTEAKQEGTIDCTVHDSAESLTIASSLLGHFGHGASVGGTLTREADVPAETSTGPLLFSTIGQQYVTSSIR
jgi:hypothetical protein